MNSTYKGFLFVDESCKSTVPILLYSPCLVLTTTIPSNASIKRAIKKNFIVSEKART